MPKISVIVPVYKVEQYLDRCVESILAQTFTDFELILVDDGSPDNCPQMCDEWAKKDGRIKVIHKQNEGVSKARNDAVQVSVGQYITFVDSDDVLHTDYLSVLYECIGKYNADISVAMINNPNRSHEDTNEITVLNNREAVVYFGQLNDERFRAPMAKLIFRNIVEAHPFPTDRNYSEDMAVVYKWYNTAETIVGIDSQLYNYEINTNGATFKKYGLHRLGNLKTINEMLCFLKSNNYQELYYLKLDEYLYQLFWQHGELLKLGNTNIAKQLKCELKRCLKFEKNIKVGTHPQYYEFAYPKRMHIYWIVKGIIGKIKRIFGVK